MAGSKVAGADPHRHGQRGASGRFVKGVPSAPPADPAGRGDPGAAHPAAPEAPAQGRPAQATPPPATQGGSVLARLWRGSLGDHGR